MMKRSNLLTVFLVLFVAAIVSPAFAAEEADKDKKTEKITLPKAAPAAPDKPKPAEPVKPEPAEPAKPDTGEKAEDGQGMVATVESVKGVAHHRQIGDAEGKWQRVKKDDKLNELTVVRTGFGAEVVVRFEDRGTIKVRSASKVGIGRLRRKGAHVTTRLGLKYGSVRAKIDRTSGTNDWRVKTPVATLSVTGSAGSFGYSGDRGLGFRSTQSTWNVNTPGGSQNVPAGGLANAKGTLSSNLSNNKLDTRMGDPNGGTRGIEQQNLMNNGGGRGIMGFAGNSGMGWTLGQGLPSPPSNSSHNGSVPNGHSLGGE